MVPQATTVANPKANHYNQALTAALLKGAWADDRPGTEPNGTELSWGELVRKWGKHTGANTELVHHLRDISLLYLSAQAHPQTSGYLVPAQHVSSASPAANPTAPVIDVISDSGPSAGQHSNGSASGSGSFVHVHHPHLRRHKSTASVNGRPNNLTASTSLGGLAATGTRAAYLSPTDLDGDEEEGSWGVGGGWWYGVGPQGVQETRESAKALETLLKSGKLKPSEVQSASLTLAYLLHGLGSHGPALNLYGQDAADATVGLLDGDAAIAERIRAQTLRGMSAELLPAQDPTIPLRAYLSVSSLVSSISSLPCPVPPYLLVPPAQSPRLPFESHREVYRWLSTALTHAAVISARMPNAIIQTLRILRTYHAYSYTWPSAFRPLQRQRMLLLYLRALHQGFPAIGVASEDPYLLGQGSTLLPARAIWLKEVSAAMSLGRGLMTSTTVFPRAGSINTPVTAFTEACVALSEKAPSLDREVIYTLWWSMNFTFQSQSVLRHLTRLLFAAGDAQDARRTFELYVQMVLKARETAQPEVSLQLKRRPTEDISASPDEIKQQATDAEGEQEPGSLGEERKAQTAESEIDGDDDFIDTLLLGAGLLCQNVGDPEEAWSYAVLAGDVVLNDERRGRGVSISLKGRVEECKGLVRLAMAAHGVEPSFRPLHQAQAINHLVAATKIDSTSSSAFYHLAFSQAEARSIEPATEAIRAALELDPKSINSWHLLALLLTAQGDWTAATKAVDAGVTVWEEAEDQYEAEETDGGVSTAEEMGVEAKDFAIVMPTPPVINAISVTSQPLLPQSGRLPPLLRSSTPPVPPNIARSKRLESVIRLRMTLNVITEKNQGAEIAMLRQQELFAFFSARSGKHRGQLGYTRGLGGSRSTVSVEGGLGGSFVSIEPPPRPPSVGLAVRPPTPTGDSVPSPPQQSTPQPLGYNVGPPTPLTQSAPSTVPSSPGITAVDDEKASGKEKDHRRSLTATRKSIAKHLHVPTSKPSDSLGRQTRPSAIRRLTPTETPIMTNRSASTSSTALSIAPTIAHSHFHSSHPKTPAPPPLPQQQAEHGRTPSESRILSNLWLMSAATFRRWGKTEQSLVSIEEAEVLDPENPEVWHQLGLYHLSSRPLSDASDPALQAFTKSTLLRPEQATSVVSLAKLHLETSQVDLAHSLLNQLTQDAGWDVPEAWYYLGKVCEAQGREERARECWVYALGLDRSRPCRPWAESAERWV